MTKAIFFDIDGTLVSFDTHRVSPAVLDALHRLRGQGIRLFVATGRHRSMLSYINSVFPFDGFVTLSGQYCFCGGQVVRRNPMEREAAEELVEAARSNAFPCIFLEGEDTYINFADQPAQAMMRALNLPLPPVCDPSRALEGELFQALAFLPRDREHLLLDRAPHLKTTRWHPSFLDVIPASGGKDHGIDAVLDYFHIPLAESMAFGDGENDLAMLRHAGTGVAMGTASSTVKAGADYVTGSVDEDGILTALKHFGLL